MKNVAKSNLIKAVSVGVSASMMLTPMTAFAEEYKVEEENIQALTKIKSSENAQDVEAQASIAEQAAQTAANALKEASFHEDVDAAQENLESAEDNLSDAADEAVKLDNQADDSEEGTVANVLVSEEANIDSTNSKAAGDEALARAEGAYDAYTKSVKAYEEAVEAAKKSVNDAKEELDAAVETAKEEVVIAAIEAIIEAEEACNDNIDNKHQNAWRAQDELFKAIVENYYLTEVYGANPDEGTEVSIVFRSFDKDEYNYFDVNYVENGVAKNIKLNYCRADENSTKELSKINVKSENSRKLIIFEKTETEDLYTVSKISGTKSVVGTKISGDDLAAKLTSGEVVEKDGEYFFRGDQIGDTKEEELDAEQSVSNEKTSYVYDEVNKQIIKKVTGDVTSLTYTGTSLSGGSGFASEEAAKLAAQAELSDGDKNLEVKVTENNETVYTAKSETNYYTMFEATIDLSNIRATVDSTVTGSREGSEEWYAAKVAIAKNIVAAFKDYDLLNTEADIVNALNNNYGGFVDKTLFDGNKNIYVYQGSITVQYVQKNVGNNKASATATGSTALEAEEAAKLAAFEKITHAKAPEITIGTDDQKVKVLHEVTGIVGIKREETIGVDGSMTITSSEAKAVTNVNKKDVINSASDLKASSHKDTATTYSYTGTYDKFTGTSVEKDVVLAETVYEADELYKKYDNTKLDEYKSSNGEKNDKVFDQARDKTLGSVRKLLDAQKETEKLQNMLAEIKDYSDDQATMDSLMGAVREAYNRLLARQRVAGNNDDRTPAIEEVSDDVLVLEAAQTPLAAANIGANIGGGNVAGNGEAELLDLDEADTPLAAFDEEKPNAITILDEETPLVSMEENVKMPWWWILIIAIVGSTTGYALYKKYNKKEEIVVNNK